MPASVPEADSLLKLAENLGELEVVIGPKARPVVAEVRAGLRDAIACRERGDLPGALVRIERAMERLAALGTQLDPAEGAMMRTLAQHFSRALSAGLKGEAKVAVKAMKSKAGDPRGGDDGNQW
ncbi:MAG TPA: hypothetical protein VKB29_08790 [Candidatus Binataceae bacterium]|nr:hypothetical protein [Candidatus Binataceae bacterium]